MKNPIRVNTLDGNGLLDTLDGIEQFPVIISFPVDGERMIQKFKEVGRVQTHGKAFALLGDGQAL